MTEIAIPGLVVKTGAKGWPQNERQVEFVRHYVLGGLTPTEAARAAGYTKHTASVKAHKMTEPLSEAIAYVRAMKARAVEKSITMTAGLTIEEIANLAMVNWQDYLRPVEMYDGTTRLYGKPLDELTRNQAGCVLSYKIRTLRPLEKDTPFIGGEVVAGDTPVVIYDYVLADRQVNLVTLAKCFNLMQTVTKGQPEQITGMPGKAIDFRGAATEDLEAFLESLDRLARRPGTEAIEGEVVGRKTLM